MRGTATFLPWKSRKHIVGLTWFFFSIIFGLFLFTSSILFFPFPSSPSSPLFCLLQSLANYSHTPPLLSQSLHPHKYPKILNHITPITLRESLAPLSHSHVHACCSACTHARRACCVESAWLRVLHACVLRAIFLSPSLPSPLSTFMIYFLHLKFRLMEPPSPHPGRSESPQGPTGVM